MVKVFESLFSIEMWHPNASGSIVPGRASTHTSFRSENPHKRTMNQFRRGRPQVTSSRPIKQRGPLPSFRRAHPYNQSTSRFRRGRPQSLDSRVINPYRRRQNRGRIPGCYSLFLSISQVFLLNRKENVGYAFTGYESRVGMSFGDAARSSLPVAAATFAGGVLGGPIGMAFGGTLGGLTQYASHR